MYKKISEFLIEVKSIEESIDEFVNGKSIQSVGLKPEQRLSIVSNEHRTEERERILIETKENNFVVNFFNFL